MKKSILVFWAIVCLLPIQRRFKNFKNAVDLLFNELVLSDKLFEHCAEIDEAARNRMELIVRSLAEQNDVTEQLKAENQMEWVRQMNACKAQAEEIVKAELIYD